MGNGSRRLASSLQRAFAGSMQPGGHVYILMSVRLAAQLWRDPSPGVGEQGELAQLRVLVDYSEFRELLDQTIGWIGFASQW